MGGNRGEKVSPKPRSNENGNQGLESWGCQAQIPQTPLSASKSPYARGLERK